jgi:Uma2 family endonuclease
MATVHSTTTLPFSLDAFVHVRLPKKGVSYSPDAFWELCVLNPDLNFERNADGSVSLITPAGGAGGNRSGETFGQLYVWARTNGEGLSFDSSSGFTLPNGAVRAPDASWIRSERWFALSEEQREKFSPIAPDFVAEVRSMSDKLPALRKKMREYIEQGVRLAWLIDPQTKSVEVYRPNQSPQRIENAKSLGGDPELPGFVLDLKAVWGRKSR